MMPVAVFDCVVLLQAAARPNSPARACLRLVEEGRLQLCVSAAVLAEARDVLTRPNVTATTAASQAPLTGDRVLAIAQADAARV